MERTTKSNRMTAINNATYAIQVNDEEPTIPQKTAFYRDAERFFDVWRDRFNWLGRYSDSNCCDRMGDYCFTMLHGTNPI